MSISHNLKDFRQNCGMTQEEVAEKMNVTRQTISSYESGRTRPDVEMLAKLAELYHTDLEGILYGQDRTLKTRKYLYWTAFLLLIFLTVSIAISSALLLYAHTSFAITPGAVQQEMRPILDIHFKIVRASEQFSALALTISRAGFVFLLLLLLLCKWKVSFREKILYLGLFILGQLLGSVPFALADPVFSMIDYTVVPISIVARGILFWGISCFLTWCMRKK